VFQALFIKSFLVESHLLMFPETMLITSVYEHVGVILHHVIPSRYTR